MDEDETHLGDSIALQFGTYEEYLDSQISAVDRYYLEDESLARQLVELGYFEIMIDIFFINDC
jgi:hypothetical protein